MLKEITPYQSTITAGSMTGTSVITSLPTNIQYKDSVSILVKWEGTPVGTFAVQGSVDYNPGYPQSGGTYNVGLWTTIPTSDQAGNLPTSSGAAGWILFNLKQMAFPWIQVVYTNTSSTGTLTGAVFAKSLG